MLQKNKKFLNYVKINFHVHNLHYHRHLSSQFNSTYIFIFFTKKIILLMQK